MVRQFFVGLPAWFGKIPIKGGFIIICGSESIMAFSIIPLGNGHCCLMGGGLCIPSSYVL